ncbi:MAG: glycosyltransferase, partial [Methylococcales bacterium]|nr:glycosyltransferase [Methylococcales bacterium]
MRIVIDMQGAQSTGSRFRGIGRYTLSLAQAIVRNRGSHGVFLALNGLFPETIEPIRDAFDGLLPQENIRVWQSPEPVSSLSNENNWRRHTAELIREAFLASLRPDIVVVSSMFEGLGDDAVTSVGTLSNTVPTAVLLYDLIPLIHRSPYLENQVVEAWYENKLHHLRRSDMLLAISESSRQEGIRYLGFYNESCVNISTAAEPQFQPAKVAIECEAAVRERYGLLKPFVMYTGGIDYRKNIEGLIRAYAILPKPLRASHQLAIVCSIQPPSRAALEMLAKEKGLKANELVLTGFVSEEDLLVLYNLCKVFVFPSWHEGFGLPALEAMCCGRAVIGANTSSLPEVIGRSDALFDPMNDTAIAEKLAQVLTDDAFRSELQQHSLEQASRFSWDESARRALAALEALHLKKVNHSLTEVMLARRPKLAYVSPLPPERSGISDYSAELLPELSRLYDIDVIVAQVSVSDPWINANCTLRSVSWLKDHTDHYDRVLYHFGNSDFHRHMFGLLEEVPGIVVLHDFFLSGIAAHMDVTGYQPGYWAQALYQSHGYAALQQRFYVSDTEEVMIRYPCNLGVLQSALGVIAHTVCSRLMAEQWYGEGTGLDWAVIPHLRVPALKVTSVVARHALNLNEDNFIVCSFGMLGPTKLNQRLLDAWLSSSLSKNERCLLVFVGENHEGDYGIELLKTIKKSGVEKRICITGWADTTVFRQYLAAADVGVQLRTLSRGETSGTVLDCMNYGLPTIVNANGSMRDLPRNAVWMLADEFTDAELVEALETLWQDGSRRNQLGTRAREVILTQHDPGACANQYAQAIESMYQRAATGQHALVKAIAALDDLPSANKALELVAKSVAVSFSPEPSQRQLFIDVSSIAQHDLKSGIERVVHAQLLELLKNPPSGFRVEPVYLTEQDGQWYYWYARSYACKVLGIEQANLCDTPIDVGLGDVFYGLDYFPEGVIEAAKTGIYLKWKAAGLSINFLVYDLLPVLSPEFFPDGTGIIHATWLKTITEFSSR